MDKIKELLKKIPLTKEQKEKLIKGLSDDPQSFLKNLEEKTFARKPVDVVTFIENSNYLNLKNKIYPVIISDLEELFDPRSNYLEAVLTGSLSWGKSTTAVLAILRMVYEASCFRDPQTAYNMMPGTKLSFINCSLSIEKACKVVFHDLKKVIMNSPYFNEIFPADKMMVESMQFPKDIEIFPTTDPIGLNVIGGVLDEINFMPVYERSKKGVDYDVGQNLHDALIRRMKGRFNVQGKMPGVLLSISSAKYPSDFTDRMEVKSKEDKTIFFRRYSVWDTIPKNRFLPEKFKISLGNSASIRPELIEKTKIINRIDSEGKPYQEKDYDQKYLDYLKAKECKVIDVPMDFYMDFKTDLEGSIRDTAGYSTQTIKPFFSNREKIYEATLRTRYYHPFLKNNLPCFDSTTLRDDIKLSPEILKPDKNPRFIHIDLATKKDHCGFCMGHVEGYTKVVRKNKKMEEYIEEAPIIAIDILLDIVAPHRGEIQISDVRALILELRTYGYSIRCVTYDTFQSVDSRQILSTYGIETNRISADSSPVPYESLKEAYNEDRISHYQHPKLIEQLKGLEWNEKKNKCDHADVKVGKDLSDSLACVTFMCVSKKPPNLIPPSFGLIEIPEVNALLNRYRPKEKGKYNIHLSEENKKINPKLLSRLGILIDTEYNEEEEDNFVGW